MPASTGGGRFRLGGGDGSLGGISFRFGSVGGIVGGTRFRLGCSRSCSRFRLGGGGLAGVGRGAAQKLADLVRDIRHMPYRMGVEVEVPPIVLKTPFWIIRPSVGFGKGLSKLFGRCTAVRFGCNDGCAVRAIVKSTANRDELPDFRAARRLANRGSTITRCTRRVLAEVYNFITFVIIVSKTSFWVFCSISTFEVLPFCRCEYFVKIKT
jgi:hypothetical protein